MKSLINLFALAAFILLTACQKESLIDIPVEDTTLEQELSKNSFIETPDEDFQYEPDEQVNIQKGFKPDIKMEFCFQEGAVLTVFDKNNPANASLNKKRFEVKWIQFNQVIGEGQVLNGCNCGGYVTTIVDDHQKKISYRMDTGLPACEGMEGP